MKELEAQNVIRRHARRDDNKSRIDEQRGFLSEALQRFNVSPHSSRSVTPFLTLCQHIPVEPTIECPSIANGNISRREGYCFCSW